MLRPDGTEVVHTVPKVNKETETTIHAKFFEKEVI